MAYDLECPFDFGLSLVKFIILAVIRFFVQQLLTDLRNDYLVDTNRLSAKQ